MSKLKRSRTGKVKCPTGKNVYPTKREARKALRWHIKQGKHMSVYNCDTCHRWHLGHDKRKAFKNEEMWTR